MLKNVMLLGVFLAMLACVCTASDEIAANPINVSKIAGANHTITTAPIEANKTKEIASATATVQSGLATQFWVQLVPYPQATRSLLLYVDGHWRTLSAPSDSNLASVLDAFKDLTRYQVRVWYSGTNIVGLVVNSNL
jgi:hypothetical protein